MTNLSIVIPAYNEEERLPRSLRSILDFFEQRGESPEIIVVDDGSADNTYEIAKNYHHGVKAISLGKNRGKGAAVRTGMLAATGDYILFCDADLSTPIYEIDKLFNQLQNGYDIAIGSRAIDKNLIKLHQPAYREIMGKTFNKFVQFITIKGISDTQCGFKCFTRPAAQKLFSLSIIDGFSFDVEILFLAKKLKYQIAEVPVEWFNDEKTKVRPLLDPVKMLIELFKIRKIHK